MKHGGTESTEKHGERNMKHGGTESTEKHGERNMKHGGTEKTEKHGERNMNHGGTESTEKHEERNMKHGGTESTKKHGEKDNQSIIEKNSVYLCVIRASVVKKLPLYCLMHKNLLHIHAFACYKSHYKVAGVSMHIDLVDGFAIFNIFCKNGFAKHVINHHLAF